MEPLAQLWFLANQITQSDGLSDIISRDGGQNNVVSSHGHERVERNLDSAGGSGRRATTMIKMKVIGDTCSPWSWNSNRLIRAADRETSAERIDCALGMRTGCCPDWSRLEFGTRQTATGGVATFCAARVDRRRRPLELATVVLLQVLRSGASLSSGRSRANFGDKAPRLRRRQGRLLSIRTGGPARRLG